MFQVFVCSHIVRQNRLPLLRNMLRSRNCRLAAAERFEQTLAIHDPYLGTNVGTVTTEVSIDGLTITNTTNEGHIFCFGKVVRSVIENADGSMSVMTQGTGNNINLGLSVINQRSGPGIFNRLDAQMRDYIRASRNAKNSLDCSYFLPGADLNQRCLGLRRTQASHAS